MKTKQTRIHKNALKREINYHLECKLCKDPSHCGSHCLFTSTAFSLRDILVKTLLKTEKKYQKDAVKRVYYLSMEFLIGRLLGNNLYNMGMFDTCKDVFAEMGFDIDEVRGQEEDAGLGNGGLGRLAACYLDSMATLGIPGFGYGIHYEYGLFKQEIDNGYQKEKPDNWLAELNPWEIKRPDEKCMVPLFGRIEHGVDRDGNYNPMWLDWKVILGVPYDIPVVGYDGKTVNWLRLYEANASSEFDIQIFNDGDYFQAVHQKIASETVSKILYPSDSVKFGKELRLIQEYFLVACSLRDIIRRYLKNHPDLNLLHENVAIQINDTHPSLGIAELMRILIDEYSYQWEHAWEITQKTFAYTNHTVLPEALETWDTSLMEEIIPRHLQIIYEINSRFLGEISVKWPGDNDRLVNMSFVKEGESKKIRMAHLAIAGSHCVNGVAELHTKILKNNIFSDFNKMWPDRFINVTNGITQRRWLLKANPELSNLISNAIGDAWITDLYQLKKLESFAYDSSFRDAFRETKHTSKLRFSKIIADTTLIDTDPASLFDIQAKRIHEYKRQLLKVMHIVYEYLMIKNGQKSPAIPKTFVFAGKAAPGYWVAKQIIKLINNIGTVINNDPALKNIMKVVFVPDYRVSLAEKLIPAADLSEQISTAGTEASGTGNMKFSLNGALTIGTLDGANIEILEEVGEENIFIFGLNADEIIQLKQTDSYRTVEYYNAHPEIKLVMDALLDDTFCHNEPGLFRWIYDKIISEGDPYFHLADFMSYIQVQEKVDAEYKNPSIWTQKAILNIARMGKFSSDRAIMEYANKVWGVS
jgi:starch phosphorylase